MPTKEIVVKIMVKRRGKTLHYYLFTTTSNFERGKSMKKITIGKKLLSMGLAVLIFASNSVVAGAAPRKEAAWPQFRGETLNPGVTDSKTPRTAEETEEAWAKKIGSGWNYSDPIIVGPYIYVTDSSNIKKLNRETGEEILSTPLAANIGFFSRLAYGEGKLFIPVGEGRIQCFDANTLESLWITAETPKEMYLQAISPVVYYDGYVYMGASSGSADMGMFYAVSAEDEDTTVGNEIKDYTWKYEPQEGKGGYYWSAGAIAGESIIFGGENGQVVSHDLDTDAVIDTLAINEAIRSSVHYDRKVGRIYVTTKSGNIHSVKVNANGTFDKDSLITKKIGSDITSSPVTYNGRVYVAGGGITSGAGFSVLDANTLEIIYQINGIASQSSPVLTTAYATEENNYTVYMYIFNYSNPDDIYVIKDFQGNTEPSYEKIARPSKPQYNSSSAAIDEDGSIYFKNDSGHLFKFVNSVNGAFGVSDVIDLINKLPNVEDITLNDEIAVKNAMERYNDLSEEDKAGVTNIDKLNSAVQKIEDLKNADKEVERLLAEIEALPSEVTLANKEKVDELFASYNRLSEEHKAKVTNADKLIKAHEDIVKLEEAELIKAMEEKIAKLPELKDVILDKEEEINSLYKDFKNLSEEAQNKVSNKDSLIKAKDKIDKVRAEVDSIEEDIWNKINPEKITLEDKEIVNELIARYNALDVRDQKYVKYFDEVLEAKKIIDKLEAEIKPETKPEVKPEVKPENKPTTKPTTKPTVKPTTKPSTKLPNTGGTSTTVVIVVAVVLLGAGAALFMKKKNTKEK